MSEPNLIGIRPINSNGYTIKKPKLVNIRSLSRDIFKKNKDYSKSPPDFSLWNYIKNNVTIYDIIVIICLIVVSVYLYNRYQNNYKNKFNTNNKPTSLKELIIDFFTDPHTYL